MDFPDERASAGLIDGIGYAAAIASGWGVALLAQSWGWSSVFGVLAASCAVALLAAALYQIKRRQPGHAAGESQR